MIRASLAVAAFLVVATSGARAADSVVTIDNFTFAPAKTTIAAGTKVTWINRDDIPHLIVGTPPSGSIRSQPLDTGDSFSFVFDRPGSYDYFCGLHPKMVGSIVVK